MTGKTLIKGGCVLTLGARTPNHPEADVLIDGGRIAEVGPGLRARDAEVVDAAGTIVMPAFVDAHRHTWRSLFRHVGDAPAPDALAEVLRPEDVYAATLIGLLGAVEAGITTVVDWCDLALDDSTVGAAFQAHADAGLRTVFVHAGSPTGATGSDAAGAVRRVLGSLRAGLPPATTLAFGSIDPAPGRLGSVADGWAAARELGLRIHAHAGSSPLDAGAIADLAGRGLIGADVTFVHCSRLDDGDFDAVAGAGASVVLSPSAEMAAGLGSPPVQRLVDRGLRPGLGVDDERIAPGDLFAQMRATISLQHATYFDLKLAGKAGLPSLLTTREVIRYATVDGARAVGLGELTGSLEVGRQADVLVLRADRPNISPVNDPIGAVVWGMDTSNVDWVFSGGRPLVRGGLLQGDIARARDLAVAAHRRVAAAAATGTDAQAGAGR